MRITFNIPEFTRNERNSHCDVLHIAPVRVANLVLDDAIAAIQTSQQRPILVHTHNRFSLFLFFPLSGCLRCCPPPQLLHPASSDSFPPSVSFLLPLVFLLSCFPHISPYRPPISALVSIVSFCPPHVTQPLSSLVLLCFVPSCFRILAAFVVVVVRSLPRFPFCTGMPVSHKVLIALHAFAPACALRRTPSLSLYPLSAQYPS